jgi:hypothetical protein
MLSAQGTHASTRAYSHTPDPAASRPSSQANCSILTPDFASTCTESHLSRCLCAAASPPSQVLLQASARAYAALANSLQQAQQQGLQPGQQGVPVMDARGQGSSSQVRQYKCKTWSINNVHCALVLYRQGNRRCATSEAIQLSCCRNQIDQVQLVAV